MQDIQYHISCATKKQKQKFNLTLAYWSTFFSSFFISETVAKNNEKTPPLVQIFKWFMCKLSHIVSALKALEEKSIKNAFGTHAAMAHATCPIE